LDKELVWEQTMWSTRTLVASAVWLASPATAQNEYIQPELYGGADADDDQYSESNVGGAYGQFADHSGLVVSRCWWCWWCCWPCCRCSCCSCCCSRCCCHRVAVAVAACSNWWLLLTVPPQEPPPPPSNPNCAAISVCWMSRTGQVDQVRPACVHAAAACCLRKRCCCCQSGAGPAVRALHASALSPLLLALLLLLLVVVLLLLLLLLLTTPLGRQLSEMLAKGKDPNEFDDVQRAPLVRRLLPWCRWCCCWWCCWWGYCCCSCWSCSSWC